MMETCVFVEKKGNIFDYLREINNLKKNRFSVISKYDLHLLPSWEIFSTCLSLNR